MSNINHQEETTEERDARISDILKKKTYLGVCISCGEDIFANDSYLDTIHGLYHGWPRTCVNGRPDPSD